MSPDEPNREWGRALARTLAAAGAGRFFLSPGARSTPLTAALAEICPGRVTAHYDERGMAFAALGWAKAAGLPAAVITTSGSAVANLHPAVIEASYGETPLVVVTADRPPELRGRGANQTIEQRGIFGGAVREALFLDCPGDLREPRETLAAVARLVRRARAEPPGPAHLNAPFREPLLSSRAGFPDGPEPGSGAEPGASETSGAEAGAGQIPDGFFNNPRGVILIGSLSRAAQAEAGCLTALGERLGWPVVADALSGAKGLPGMTRHADFFLHRRDVPPPERVLHVGGALVSKRVALWARSCAGADYVQARLSPARLDPYFQNPRHLRLGIRALCDAAAELAPAARDAEPARRIAAFERAAEKVIAEALDGLAHLTEPGIARAVSRSWRGALFLGNSMPVRDFDAFAGRPGGCCPVFGNRGASGIDGNIATLAGVAMGLGAPVLGVIGDLAFLHDLPSLALLRGLPVALLVVNNGGGGIFRFVPEGLEPADRERFWETPHGMTFEAAAAQFGLRYERPATPDGLRAVLCGPGEGPLLIECVTDRAENETLHRELAARMRAAAVPVCAEEPPR